MFNLHWMPDPDLCRDETDKLAECEHIEEAFRSTDSTFHLTWEFDGDGWSSNLVFRGNPFAGVIPYEVGKYYISRLH